MVHLLQISRQEVVVAGGRVVANAGGKKVTDCRRMEKWRQQGLLMGSWWDMRETQESGVTFKYWRD